MTLSQKDAFLLLGGIIIGLIGRVIGNLFATSLFRLLDDEGNEKKKGEFKSAFIGLHIALVILIGLLFLIGNSPS